MTSIRAVRGEGASLPPELSTIEAVEEALVAVHELERRSPGGGRWPYAGDAPWHLIQGEAGDYAGDGADGVSSSARPRTALDAAEVAERDRVTAWLQWIADPLDRRLVWLATGALHRGESRVPWGALAGRLGSKLTRQALLRRYRGALALIVCRLNGWPVRRAKQLLAGDGLVAEPLTGGRPAFVIVDNATAG